MTGGDADGGGPDDRGVLITGAGNVLAAGALITGAGNVLAAGALAAGALAGAEGAWAGTAGMLRAAGAAGLRELAAGTAGGGGSRLGVTGLTAGLGLAAGR